MGRPRWSRPHGREIFVVCNLASLCLGAIDVDDPDEVEYIAASAVRALDNVIDLNFLSPWPMPELPIRITEESVWESAVTIICWQSTVYGGRARNIWPLQTWCLSGFITRLSGPAPIWRLRRDATGIFEGSEWQTGAYFEKRGLVSREWKELAEQVAEHGMRNAYLLAVAPTSSTSILSGTTAGLDPVMKRFYLEEKKNAILPRVAPDLTPRTFWLYKSGYTMDQTWTVRAAGVRQRHIDQAQSVNLYITNDYTMRQLLNLYILAWESGVKTLYYVRSKSLEVEECESCSS